MTKVTRINVRHSSHLSTSMKQIYTYILLLLFGINFAYPQGEVVDEVVAVVGSNIVLLSDIENQYLQYRMQGSIQGGGTSVRCQIFENLLFQKLLLNQAEIDSIIVTADQVEEEMDNKLRYYIRQFGSKDKFEDFYKKSVEIPRPFFCSHILASFPPYQLIFLSDQ